MPRIKGPSPEQIAQHLSESPDGAAADLGLSMIIAYKLLAWFAVIPGVLGLRSRYGERYLTPDTALFSWLIVAVACFGTSLTEVAGAHAATLFGHPQNSSAGAATSLLVVLWFWAMLAIRFGAIVRRWINDDFSVHSRSDGDPWRVWYLATRFLPYSVQDFVVRCLLEPFAIFLAGVAVDLVTGSHLIALLALFAALGFFVQQVLLQQELRRKLLDAADAEIEAEEFRRDRERLQRGGEPVSVFVPPRARSALSALSVQQLRSAQEAARQAGASSSQPEPAPKPTPAE